MLTVKGNCTLNTVATGVIENKIDGLTINVAQDSVLTTKKIYSSYGTLYPTVLSLYENTTITGSGKLTLSSVSSGISFGDSIELTIKDADIKFSCDDVGIRGALYMNCKG